MSKVVLSTRTFLPEDASYLQRVKSVKPVGFGDRPLILVVDMCHEFIARCGERGRTCLNHTLDLLAVGRAAKVPIFFSRMERDKPKVALRWKHRSEGRAAPGLQEVAEEVHARPEERIIVKHAPSVFWETNIQADLARLGADTLIVCGLVTSGCVRATVVDAFSHGYRVIVPAECVSDPSQTSHEVCLVDIHYRYADVLELAEVVRHLEGLRAS